MIKILSEVETNDFYNPEKSNIGGIKIKKISNKIKELKKELDEKNLKNATAAYAAIVEEVAKEYTDGTIVETLRKEHPEINFMDYDKIEKLLEHAKNERRRKKNEKY